MDYSVARAINIVHQSQAHPAKSNANLAGVFLYSNGAMTNLGTLEAALESATELNASGQVRVFAECAGYISSFRVEWRNAG